MLKCNSRVYTDDELKSNLRQSWTEDDNVRLLYIVYRVVVCLFFWSNIIYTWTQTHSFTYLVFLTHWGICLLCVTILLETLITIAIFCNASPGRYLMLGSWLLVLVFYTLAVFITILYWSMLYNNKNSYVNLFVHGLQGVFVILDQCMSNRAWPLHKIWICFPVPVLYLVFNLIYWGAGGMVDGNHYIYSVLDWGDKPGNAVLTVFIAVVSLPLIYSVFWLLTIIRNKLHIKLHQKEGQNNLGFSGEV